MRIPLTMALVAALCAPARAVCQDYQTSLSFEAPTLADWSGGPRETLYQDSVVVHGGRFAGRIDRGPDAASQFSTFTLALPIGFAGKTLELRGWLRTESVSGYAGLWLREDGINGPVQFDNMQSRNLSGTTGWTEYRISLPLDERARVVNLGALLSGRGTLWVDDLTLVVDGVPAVEAPAIVRAPSPIERDTEFDSGSRLSVPELTARRIEDLALLGRVWGFAKYHHPRVTGGEVNWDYELFRVLPAVLAAPDPAAVRGTLSAWLARLGDPAPCDRCPLPADLHLAPDLAWIRDRSSLGEALSARLDLIHRGRSVEPEQHYVRLVPSVGNPDFSNESTYARSPLPDAGFRLLALYRLWNIVEYWFPYRDVIGEEWEDVLLEFIPRVIVANTADEYRLALLEAAARINDTHVSLRGGLSVQPPVGSAALPVVVRFVEGEAVVTGFSDPALGPATGLEVGDVIDDIDGQPVDSLVTAWRPFYPASNQAARLREMARNLTRGAAGPVRITGERAAGTFELTAERVPLASLDPAAGRTHDLSGATFQRLSEEVAYLKLSSISSDSLPAYLTRAVDADVLVSTSEIIRASSWSSRSAVGSSASRPSSQASRSPTAGIPARSSGRSPSCCRHSSRGSRARS